MAKKKFYKLACPFCESSRLGGRSISVDRSSENALAGYMAFGTMGLIFGAAPDEKHKYLICFDCANEFSNEEAQLCEMSPEDQAKAEAAERAKQELTTSQEWSLSLFFIFCAYFFSSIFAALLGIVFCPIMRWLVLKHPKSKLTNHQLDMTAILIFLIWISVAFFNADGSKSKSKQTADSTLSNSITDSNQ
ncbi:MAG: hypothetical protein ABL930_04575 [Pseudobdellovibrio sp.]